MYGRDFRYAEQCLDWIFLLLLNKYGHLVTVRYEYVIWQLTVAHHYSNDKIDIDSCRKNDACI